MKLLVTNFDELKKDPDAVIHNFSSKQEVESLQFSLGNISEVDLEVIELRDVIIISRGGIVWKNYWIDGNSIHYYDENWFKKDWRPGNLDETKKFIYIEEEFLREHSTVSDPVFFCDSGWASINFGHFVHDLLPYGYLFRKLVNRFPKVVPILHRMKWDSQEKIIDGVFGIHVEKCAISDGNMRVSHLFLARRQTLLDGDRWRTSFSGIRSARQLALKKFQVDHLDHISAVDSPVKVFLHRTLDPNNPNYNALLNGRNFQNIEEVVASLLDAGFLVMEPGKLPIEVVASLLSRASVVVGIHGANLGNIIFCPEGTQVYELRPASGVWADYEALACVLGHHFLGVTQAFQPEGKNPIINVSELMSLLCTTRISFKWKSELLEYQR